jgi:shikimate kinase
LKAISGKNLVLIGFMGTGKTETGKLLAASLNRRFIDTDKLIEKEEKAKISEIFAAQGEEYFRRREKEVIARLCRKKGLVISTGGGSLLARENRKLLAENSFVIWLDASFDELRQRLTGDVDRPLLKEQDFSTLYEKRLEGYRETAHVKIDTTDKSPLMVSEEIMELLRRG